MIPHDCIANWRNHAPWVEDRQVEQDLVISRALAEMYSHPVLAERLAFRGGRALYKLHLMPPLRYSEDIDLVQRVPGPVGPMMDAFHEVLDPWLGRPRWKQSQCRVTLIYRFESEEVPSIRLRLKVEINTCEHFDVFGLKRIPFKVKSSWFEGEANGVICNWTCYSPQSCVGYTNVNKAGICSTFQPGCAPQQAKRVSLNQTYASGPSDNLSNSKSIKIFKNLLQ